MLLMLLGVIPAPALEIYRDVSHTRAYASIRGRWNAGVAIKPERQATESVRIVTMMSP